MPDCKIESATERDFYRVALDLLHRSKVPFLVGGAYALQHHVGVIRRTKDLDVFVLPSDVHAVLEVFQRAGFRTGLPFPHWLGKVFQGDCLLDVIFSSGNGICRVDQTWFEHAPEGRVLDVAVRLCPVEETIWQKAFILERDRCDVADVAHLMLEYGDRLDWERLIGRFAEHWRLLVAHLALFEFLYPDHRARIPAAVRSRLFGQLADLDAGEKPDRARCFGPLLSATQYAEELAAGHFEDVRKQPPANLTDDQIAAWTANFVKAK